MARPDLSSSKEKETTTTTGSTTPDTMAIDYDTLPDFDAPEFNRKRPRTEPRPKQPQHPPSQSQSQSQSSRDSLPRPTSTSQSHPNAKKKQSPRVDLNAQRAQEQAQQARQAFLYGTGPGSVPSQDNNDAPEMTRIPASTSFLPPSVSQDRKRADLSLNAPLSIEALNKLAAKVERASFFSCACVASSIVLFVTFHDISWHVYEWCHRPCVQNYWAISHSMNNCPKPWWMPKKRCLNRDARRPNQDEKTWCPVTL